MPLTRRAETVGLLLLSLQGTVVVAQLLPVREQGRTYQNVQPFDRGVLGNMEGSQWNPSRGSMNVQISRRQAFIVTIKLGTPAQTLRCLLDSGSSDLWVPSDRCVSCNTANHFRAAASGTFGYKVAQTRWGSGPKSVKVTYGSGEIVGYDVRDVLDFGGVVIREQPFILVQQAHLPDGRLWDGICGLGWEQIAQVQPPLYRKVQDAGYPALFSLIPTGQHDASLQVGQMPESMMEPGSLVWAAAERAPTPGSYGAARTFWVTTGGLAIRRVNPVRARFLVDTGTNQVLLAPRSRYTSFMNSLFPNQIFGRDCGMDHNEGMVVCDCRIANERLMKPLRIYLGNSVTQSFPLTVAELFVQVPARGGGVLCLLQIQPNTIDGASSMSGMLGGGLGGLLGGLLSGLLGSTVRSVASGGGIPYTSHMVINQSQFDKIDSESEVQEIVEERPNGTICNTTRFVSEGEVKGQETHCTGAGAEAASEANKATGAKEELAAADEGRRLQTGDSEMWMIGGVFMKYYITIFDFDHARMGFAKPKQRVMPPAFGQDQLWEMGPLPWDLRGWSRRTAVFRLLLLPALGVVAACCAAALLLLVGWRTLSARGRIWALGADHSRVATEPSQGCLEMGAE